MIDLRLWSGQGCREVGSAVHILCHCFCCRGKAQRVSISSPLWRCVIYEMLMHLSNSVWLGGQTAHSELSIIALQYRAARLFLGTQRIQSSALYCGDSKWAGWEEGKLSREHGCHPAEGGRRGPKEPRGTEGGRGGPKGRRRGQKGPEVAERGRRSRGWPRGAKGPEGNATHSDLHSTNPFWGTRGGYCAHGFTFKSATLNSFKLWSNILLASEVEKKVYCDQNLKITIFSTKWKYFHAAPLKKD